MTKRQYLANLKKELKIFNDNKQKEYYQIYKNKYDNYEKEGLSELEIEKKLGTIDSVINDILEKEKKGSNKKSFNNSELINLVKEEAKDFFKKLGSVFNVNDDNDLFSLIINIFLILISIAFLKIPFLIFKEIGLGMFNIFPNILSGLFSVCWSLIIQLVYFVTSIYLLYIIIKKVFLIDDSNNTYKLKEEIKNNFNFLNNKQLNNSIMRVILFIITLPLYFISFFLFIAIGIVVGLILNGVMITGILIILISLLIIFTSIIRLVNRMVLGSK